MPIWQASLGALASSYWAFTPLHDATHRSVSRHRWLNDLVGWVCAVTLLAPFSAFRYMHLTHHKYTNDPVRDPDYWSGTGSGWLLPLRWLTQDFHYELLAVRVSKEEGLAFSLQTWGAFTILHGTVVWIMFQGLAWEMVWLVLVPSRLSVAALAATFDWLPHAPHEVESKSDRFRATSILIDPWLTPLFLFQNYHLIHHLYPAVPWYRYVKVWRLDRDRLIERGARVRSVVPSWRRGQPAVRLET